MRTITAGAMVRRQVRRILLLNDIPFQEEKGFIDSIFFLEDKYVEKVRKLLPNQ